MDGRVRRACTVAVVIAATTLSGCAVVTSQPGPTGDVTSSAATGPLVRVGVGPEQESALLGAVLAALAEQAGFRARVEAFADSGAVRQALEVGDVDVAPGYTGQTWLEELGRENPPGDPRTSFQGVSAADESNGITWLRPAFDLAAGVGGPPADATLALWVTPEVAIEAPSIAELGSVLTARPDAEVCLDAEFAERADGWAAVSQRYSIAARVLVEATPPEAVAGVAAGQCLVGLSTLTDGQAWAAELVPLADPLEVFPAFVVSVQLNEGALERAPGLDAALQPLADDLTTALLGTWNARVQVGEELDQVALVAVTQLADGGDEDG
jgi:glycine betaine/choline ABC-type transport system substrate-binding protein